MKPYEPLAIEPKWQKIWQDTKLYEANQDKSKRTIYATPMLPYPSGAGLHVGHVRNYSISDTVARFYRQRGYNVLSCMGWDSFGLPAENYAIKTGTPPQQSTEANIVTFKNQLQRLGMSYDWSRELNTSDPNYYRWTQWLFLQFFKQGLAYTDESLQWWCTKCMTVLANEQVVDQKCWRHDGDDDPLVEKRKTKQWFLKITDYADKLLEELDGLDWPSGIKMQQKNWIGRSSGAEIVFDVEGSDQQQITVFTTRPDTIFGATFIVLAPENDIVKLITTNSESKQVEEYVTESVKKSDIERMDESKQKSGKFTGAYALHPLTKEKLPIWVSDFVLGGYGTGSIMGVPAHDERDYTFATRFNLPVRPVVAKDFGEPRPNETGVEGSVVIGYDKGTGKYLGLKNDDGSYWLVGGGRDEGEDFKQAASRELKEETGYSCDELHQLGDPVYSHYYNEKKDSNRRSLGYNYLAVIDASQTGGASRETHEDFEPAWLEFDDLKSEILKTGGGVEHWLDALDRAKSLVESGFDAAYARHTGEGILLNSGKYDGMSSTEAREQIVADLAKSSQAQEKVNYRMRDWLVSRQRYWGAPIPIINCKDCGAVSVPEADLPVELPQVDDYLPTGNESSVLASVKDWVNVQCPSCSKPAKRETDTLDGYVCSSWYMYRYCDPNNTDAAWDSTKVNDWFPIDFYFGADHAVAHLLYFRFWGHFFAEQGLVATDKAEPIKKLVYNGYINAADGRKMSKSYGNVVDPLEVIDSGYGADALRMFELFIGPYDQDAAWNPNGVPGTYRFLQRVWALTQSYIQDEDTTDQFDAKVETLLMSDTHKTIKKVTKDLESQKFNTAIAACMKLVNSLNAHKQNSEFAAARKIWGQCLSQLVQLIAPFAPHISEELWHELGHDESIHISPWPVWDEELVKEDLVTIVVQINGKLKDKCELPVDTPKEEVIASALGLPKISTTVGSKAPSKTIYIENKLINFVI